MNRNSMIPDKDFYTIEKVLIANDFPITYNELEWYNELANKKWIKDHSIDGCINEDEAKAFLLEERKFLENPYNYCEEILECDKELVDEIRKGMKYDITREILVPRMLDEPISIQQFARLSWITYLYDNKIIED